MKKGPDVRKIEIYNEENPQRYIVGEWVAKDDLFFLDFSKQLFPISVFDSENLEKQMIVNFFYNFLEDVNKFIPEQDKELEYIPTQVISEFFRCVFLTNDQKRLSGIIYPSKKGNGLYYAVFYPSGVGSHLCCYDAILTFTGRSSLITQ